MDIRLLGPELENVQSDARKELSETIERKQREIEREVIESLSELASDGKRVLKSQKDTYEMMLQLDGLVKSNESLFLRVNQLCTKTGVSLNAIIERMVAKNREIRAEEPVIEPAAAIELPQADDLDKKKIGSESGLNTGTAAKKDGLNYSLGQGPAQLGIEDKLALLEWPDDGGFDPDAIKYDWQKSAFSVEPQRIVQDLPVESFDEQTFDAPGMSDEEIRAAQENLAATSEYGVSNLKDTFAPKEPDVPVDASCRRVKGRRLHKWSSASERYVSVLKVTIFGENFEGRSDDYRNISVQIGNLQLSYREFSPEDDNVTLDALDQAIGASKQLDVTEKRRLYRKLNSGAKKVERYARLSGNHRNR